MRVVGLQLVGEVDYAEGVEWALLHADAAAAAYHLGDVGLPVVSHSDRLAARSHHGAEPDADLVTLVGLALLLVDDGDPQRLSSIID